MIVTIAGRGYRFDMRPQWIARENARSKSEAVNAFGDEVVRYVTTSDGISLAIAEIGSGFPVVKVSNWMSHIETDLDNPLWAKLFRAIASSNRLVRYDGRGIGLSDRKIAESKITFEKFVLDLETVIDSLNVEKVNLLGVSMGGAAALAYAHKHPERVHRIALHGAFPIGRRRRNSAEDTERANLFLALMRQGWGTNNEAFVKAFAQIYLPGGSPEELQWFSELQQKNASADVAVSIRAACDDIDVTEKLPTIQNRTLVTHCRDDMVVPIDQAKYIASRLSDAEFQVFESSNHIILDREAEADRFAETVARYLAG